MKRCMNCMKQIEDSEKICRFCGYDSEKTQEMVDELQAGSRLADRFIIGNTLGRGGFGITYVAWDENLKRRVAIKEYMPRGLASRDTGATTVKCDKNSKDSFERGIEKTIEESRKMAGLSYLDSVVTVHDFFKENGTAYIVMELLEGRNVKEYLKEKGKLSFEETIRIMTPILNTLSAVHKQGIIHRDISPDNIFLCNDGRIKLLDFGSARTFEGMAEGSHSIVFKHGYAPKEQYSSKGKHGTYTDMYATAATIYKMLTGITPQESIERLTGDDELQNISEIVDISKNAAYAIMQGLELKEKDRIQTADEFLEKLSAEDKPLFAGDATVTMSSDAVRQKYGDLIERAGQKTELQISPSVKPKTTENEIAKQESEEKVQKYLKRIISIAVAAFMVVLITVIGVKMKSSKLLFEENSVGLISETESIANTKQSTTDENTSTSETQNILQKKFANVKVGDVIKFGSYEQDNIASNSKEEIEWRVLEVKDGKALIISEKALDSKPYNTEYIDITWETSSLRKWCNENFFNVAFNADEKGIIASAKVSANSNPNYSTNSGNDTDDKIFILSITEVEKYFASDEERKCVPTEYAIAQGTYTSSSHSKGGKATCWWWLRSPGCDQYTAASVYSYGTVYYVGDFIDIGHGAVRPALWIKI